MTERTPRRSYTFKSDFYKGLQDRVKALEAERAKTEERVRSEYEARLKVLENRLKTKFERSPEVLELCFFARQVAERELQIRMKILHEQISQKMKRNPHMTNPFEIDLDRDGFKSFGLHEKLAEVLFENNPEGVLEVHLNSSLTAVVNPKTLMSLDVEPTGRTFVRASVGRMSQIQRDAHDYTFSLEADTAAVIEDYKNADALLKIARLKMPL